MQLPYDLCFRSTIQVSILSKISCHVDYNVYACFGKLVCLMCFFFQFLFSKYNVQLSVSVSMPCLSHYHITLAYYRDYHSDLSLFWEMIPLGEIGVDEYSKFIEMTKVEDCIKYDRFPNSLWASVRVARGCICNHTKCLI